MADFALVMTDFGGDMVVDGLDLARDDGLEPSVILSLFTNRRASAEQLPAELRDGDLQGYWGDVSPPVENDQFGSLLWLLAREKQTNTTLSRARQYARDALQWLIDDRVATRVDVEASYPARGIILLAIDIYRPGREVVRFRYDYEWSAQAAKRAD